MLGREIHSARGRALVGSILARKCGEKTRWEVIDRNREKGRFEVKRMPRRGILGGCQRG